jgi:hypothetical protein
MVQCGKKSELLIKSLGAIPRKTYLFLRNDRAQAS